MSPVMVVPAGGPLAAGRDSRTILVAAWTGSQNPEAWIALVTLTVMEIVLGIDNIVFISVLVQRLPEEQRDRARGPSASASPC